MNTMPQHANAFKVMAIYKFAALRDCAELCPAVQAYCRARGIRGTLILAPEGINGTVAGHPEAIDELAHWLMYSNIFKGRLRGAETKFSFAGEMPFLRLKIRLKKEIVTLRAPEADPNKIVGTYVSPEHWNELISGDDVTVLDTRNDYEYAIGSFDGAIDPATRNFTEFKHYVAKNLDPSVNKKIAMFCTGGIRCEKATAYMLAHGFEDVYHLQGGILKYLETVPAEHSKWHGECFVFDERVSVGHGLKVGEAQLCRACRFPLSKQERAHSDFIQGVQCPHCSGEKYAKIRASAAERQKQMELAEKNGTAHLGDDAISAARARAKAKKARREADRERSTKCQLL